MTDIPTPTSKRKLPLLPGWLLHAVFGGVLITIFALGGVIALAVILGWQP
jgi:hypothetical protein